MDRSISTPNKIQTHSVARIRSYLVLGLLSLIWGSSYILIKKGLTVFDPVQLGALRLTIAGMAFVPFLSANRSKISWKKWLVLFIVGMTGIGLPSLLFPLAQLGISSSLAGIFNAMTPLFTLLTGILLFRNRLLWSKLLGVIIGLAGTILLILRGADAGLEGSAGFALLALAGSFCYAISSNIVATYLSSMSALTISASSLCLVSIPAAFYLFGSTDFLCLLKTDPNGWQALAYVTFLALFNTVLASVIYFQLIKWTNALFASSVCYLAPIVALGWGIADGETVTIIILTGMLLIFSGLYLSRS